MLGLAGPAGAAVWLIQPTAEVPGGGWSDLKGVSCTSSSACTIVGSYVRKNGSGNSVRVTLAERWDGTRWSIQPTPNPAVSVGQYLDGVSCTSSTACTAVGSYDYKNGSGNSVWLTLAERWDGTCWSMQPTPNPPGATYSFLDDVSCTSSTACTAVGSYEYKNGSGNSVWLTLAEHWDGTRWSIQPTPNPVDLGGGQGPYGVSCTSSTACAAVFEGSLFRWNGTRWSTQPTPSPSFQGAAGVVGISTTLSGVSCTSSTTCTAVGSFESDTYEGDLYTTVEFTLAERWNGQRWSIQATPNPSHSIDAKFRAVSCPSSSACIAVGTYASDAWMTLAERWDGKRWSIQPTPNHPGSDTMLDDVSCTSSTACTAIGHYSGVERPLVERLTPATPVSAKLTGIPTACVRAAFTAHINGVGIASVSWSADGKRIRGRTVHRGTAYAASVALTPGRHRLTAKVTFVASSHITPRTFTKTVNGCSPPSRGLG